MSKIPMIRMTAIAVALTLLAIPTRGQSSALDIERVAVTPLAAPPFKKLSAKPGRTRVRLDPSSGAPNAITDDAEWFKRVQTRLNQYSVLPGDTTIPTLGAVPGFVPRTFRGLSLVKAIGADNGIFLIYGKDGNDGRLLVRCDVNERGSAVFAYAYDFSAYLDAPRKDAETIRFEKQYGEGLVTQRINWVAERDGVLYVANAHNTYAKSSLNQNAYITAIDLRTNAIKWRSAPLVCNSSTFEIVDDAIICGYGFTNEPDFLYVLDRSTGDIAQKQFVKSGPTYIILKGKFLYVRCYNSDYAFKVNS